MKHYEKQIKISKSEEEVNGIDPGLKPVGLYAVFFIFMLLWVPMSTIFPKPESYFMLSVPFLVFVLLMARLWMDRPSGHDNDDQ